MEAFERGNPWFLREIMHYAMQIVCILLFDLVGQGNSEGDAFSDQKQPLFFFGDRKLVRLKACLPTEATRFDGKNR